MSVNTDFVAALPVGSSANKQLLRNALYTRQPYVLADADLPTDLTAVDPASGSAIIDIFYLGRNFHYDPTDTTSANDGVSVLVSNEGRRYKLSDAAGVFAFAVINATTTVPPVSPSIGDAYLVASGATGAWAGQDNNVATRTRRGWEFIVYGVGRLLYVENTDSYMHKTSGGSWELGFGTQALTAGSVPITAVIGAEASFVIKVENQTTNAPPASPTVPTAYIIGPSPTGAWAANAGSLAICLVAGSFTIITPVNGDQVYDKAKNAVFQFNGTSWLATNGVFLNTKRVESASYITTLTNIPLDDTIPQITEGDQVLTTTYTPASITNKLRIRFEANCSSNTNSTTGIIALFLNSNSNALRSAARFFVGLDQTGLMQFSYEFVPGTTSAITLSIRAGIAGSGRMFINGNTAGRILGGSDIMSLTIDEIIV